MKLKLSDSQIEALAVLRVSIGGHLYIGNGMVRRADGVVIDAPSDGVIEVLAGGPLAGGPLAGGLGFLKIK